MVFVAPSGTRVLVDGSFDLGEILQSLRIFNLAPHRCLMQLDTNGGHFQWEKELIPPVSGVTSQVAFGSPSAARNLVSGSFGLGEINQSLHI